MVRRKQARANGSGVKTVKKVYIPVKYIHTDGLSSVLLHWKQHSTNNHL